MTERNPILATLTNFFNKGELSALCFRLGTSLEALGGDHALPEKARELVEWADRSSRTDELVEAILEMKGENPRVRESLFGEGGEETNKPAPYLGLRTFGEEEARYFFGRAALVAELTQHVGAAPFLAVLGPSGSGKSSAVLAGLLPKLKEGALPGSELWRYAILKPGTRPLDALAATLAQVQGSNLADALAFRPILASNERALLTLADMLRAGSDTRLVLVVDQFEELWTQAPTDPEKQRAFAETERLPFLRLLLAGTTGLSDEARATAPLSVILTMRADFLHRALEVPELARAIQNHLVLVSPMSREESREAIEEPARGAGATLETGLAAEMVEAVAEQPGALPLLQYTLLELWKLRQQRTLTRAAYRALGGVTGALAKSADALLEKHYPDTQRKKLRHLLLRLVQPGEGAADTRRRALLREVVPANSSPAAVQSFLQPLVNARLLTTGRDAATGEETIDLSHESLIRAWPTLQGWIDDGRDNLRLHRQLETDAREWQRHGEDPDLLWPALRVANAEAWQARANPALSATEAHFLAASRVHVDTTRRERQALLEARARAGRRMIMMLLVLLFVTTGLGGFAWNAATREANTRVAAQSAADEAVAAAEREAVAADRAEAEAQRSQALAFAGEAMFALTQGETDHAMSLAVAASQGVTDTYPLLVSRALRETLQHSSTLILGGHSGAVLSVAWSLDGRQVLAGSIDGTAWLWEVRSGQLLRTFEGHHGSVLSVAWSPDGNRVLTGSADGTARLWEAKSGQLIHIFEGHSGSIRSVGWSPDGSQVLTGSADNTARLWETGSGQLLRTLEGHNGWVWSVAWSPDGSQVLTGGDDSTARLWEARSGRLLRTFEGYNGSVWSVAWSPDGTQVLTGSADGTARLWETESGQLLRTFEGHNSSILSVAWSPDGRQVLTGSADNTGRLWEAGSGHLVRTLEGHDGSVSAMGWSPDGSQVLTGSTDGMARLWDAESGQLVRTLEGHRGAVLSVGWNPDGRQVVTGSDDGTARLWEVEDGHLLRTLEGHNGPVWSVAWSPDGRQVLTGSADGTARLWEARSGHLIHIFEGHNDWVRSVAWSPDGSRVLTGSDDGTARLWATKSGQLVSTLEGHRDWVRAVGWSPDGSQVLTGSADGTARLWEARSGHLLRTLEGHNGFVRAVGWSPDGSQVLTGSDDGTARLWEARSGQLVRAFEGHRDWVWSVGWSPDGTQVLTGSADRTARLWEVGSGQLVRTIEGHNGSVSSVGWSPDGSQVLTGSADGTARLWLASDRLVVAALIRRTCTNFTDEQIRATVPTWQGNCAELLEAVKEDADEYERLLGLRK